MDKKNENAEKYFEFPPCRNRLLFAGRRDANHDILDGEPLFVVMRDCLNLEMARPAYHTQTGISPKNVDRSFYAPGAEIFSTSYGFLPGDLVTPALLAGVRQYASDASKAWLETLIRSKAIVPVGKTEADGSWMNYRITPDGVDAIFPVNTKIMSAVIRPIDPETGYPVFHLPVGKLFMATRDLSMSGCSPNTAALGSLICEACIPGAAGLVEQARVIEAGKVVNMFSSVELNEPVKDLFRNLAIIEIDERLSGTPRTDAQKACIDRLFNAAIEAAGVPACS